MIAVISLRAWYFDAGSGTSSRAPRLGQLCVLSLGRVGLCPRTSAGVGLVCLDGNQDADLGALEEHSQCGEETVGGIHCGRH